LKPHWPKVTGVAAAVVAATSATHAMAPAAAKQCTWSACSRDAQWMRSVLRHAGLRNLGSTGSALTARVPAAAGSRLYYFWATPGTRLAAPFKPVYTTAGTGVFGDGTRIVWRTQGARVWIEPALPQPTVAPIVRASRSTPRR